MNEQLSRQSPIRAVLVDPSYATPMAIQIRTRNHKWLPQIFLCNKERQGLTRETRKEKQGKNKKKKEKEKKEKKRGEKKEKKKKKTSKKEKEKIKKEKKEKEKRKRKRK